MYPTISVDAGTTYFRISSEDYRTADPKFWSRVVDGAGSKYSGTGSRFAPRLAETVYIAEDADSCIAEKMFYFHREILNALDFFHFTKSLLPHFWRRLTLWEIRFLQNIPHIIDLTVTDNLRFFEAFPALLMSPSQDYEHLKDLRIKIQMTREYKGLRAPASRSRTGGKIIVLFDDQSQNVQDIRSREIEFRLIRPDGLPFQSPESDFLDLSAGEVRIGRKSISSPASLEAQDFEPWRRIEFAN